MMFCLIADWLKKREATKKRARIRELKKNAADSPSCFTHQSEHVLKIQTELKALGARLSPEVLFRHALNAARIGDERDAQAIMKEIDYPLPLLRQHLPLDRTDVEKLARMCHIIIPQEWYEGNVRALLAQGKYVDAMRMFPDVGHWSCAELQACATALAAAGDANNLIKCISRMDFTDPAFESLKEEALLRCKTAAEQTKNYSSIRQVLDYSKDGEGLLMHARERIAAEDYNNASPAFYCYMEMLPPQEDPFLHAFLTFFQEFFSDEGYTKAALVRLMEKGFSRCKTVQVAFYEEN